MALRSRPGNDAQRPKVSEPEASMDEPEREHFLNRIDELEAANRRWRLGAVVLGILCVLLLLIDGVALVEQRRHVQMVARMRDEAKMERRRAEEHAVAAVRARAAAEQRLQEAQQQLERQRPAK